MPHKDCNKRNAYSRAYYATHKDVINGRQVGINRNRRQNRYAEIRKLKGRTCDQCDLPYPAYVMDFHHRAVPDGL